MGITTSAALELAGILLSIGVLGAASLSDLKTREVSNRFWMLYAPVAMLLFIVRITTSADVLKALTDFSVPAGATFVVAFLLFQFGVMGGADSKALMCLGLCLPTFPSFLLPLWSPPFGSFYPFPIAVLVNSFLLSIGSAVFLLARNLAQRMHLRNGLFQGFEKESITRKILVLLTSYKTTFTVMEAKPHLYPVEQVDLVDSKPVRHFHLVSSAETDRDKLISGLQNYKEQGLFSNGIWVTPGLPHLVFMTASLIVTVFIGDLLMWAFLKTLRVS